MTTIFWSPAFATGVKEIDDQHKCLIGYINELNNVAGVSEHDLSRILESAIDYTFYHFAFEEAVLESLGYKLLDPHKRVHELFAKELAELKRQFQSGDMAAHSLRETLARWLFDHVSKADTSALRTNLP